MQRAAFVRNHFMGVQWRGPRTLLGILLRLPSLAALALLYLVLAAALVYLGSIVWGLAVGFALPTTAAIRWPWVRALAVHDYYLVYGLLSVTALCAATSWVAWLAGCNDARKGELQVMRFLGRWGLLLSVAIFVFTISGPWAGLPRQGDFGAAAVGGLVPFSDAISYFATAHDHIRDGVWNQVALRRPLAAAFREVLTVFGLFSFPAMLFLQTLLIAAATWFAAGAIARWRGTWAGLTFFGLMFLAMRSFLPTSLTEPLGLIWALFSIPFFVVALRERSLAHALAGFAIIVVALMTRMGAMFIVPALMLWLIWQFGQSWRAKLRVGIVSIAIVAGVLSANSLLQRSFGTGQDISGSNFAYTLCGLSIAQIYSACVERYQDELKALPGGEAAATRFLYARAWDNIRKDPSVFLARVAEGARRFTSALPTTLVRGYLWVTPPAWFTAIRPWAVVLTIVGACYIALRRREKGEVAFWLLIGAGIWASAAFVYFDDGMRAMSSSYPFVVALVACGMTTPGVVLPVRRGNDRVLLRCGAGTLALAAVLFFAVPWLAHEGRRMRDPATVVQSQHEHLIFGGRRITGFLVVPDGEALRSDVPSVHISDFSEIVRLSNIEIYQGLVQPETPPLPFGFVAAPRMEKGAASVHMYIVPPEVMLRRAVPGWRLSVTEWQRKHYSYWYLVTGAEPIAP